MANERLPAVKSAPGVGLAEMVGAIHKSPLLEAIARPWAHRRLGVGRGAIPGDVK